LQALRLQQTVHMLKKEISRNDAVLCALSGLPETGLARHGFAAGVVGAAHCLILQ